LLKPQDERLPVKLSLSFDIAGRPFRYDVEREEANSQTTRLQETLSGPESQVPMIRRDGETIRSHWHNGPLQVGIQLSAMSAVMQLSTAASEATQTLTPIRNALHGIRYYRATDNISDHESTASLVLESQYIDWLANKDGKYADSVAFRLISLKNDPDQAKFSELTELLGAAGLGLIDLVMIARIPMPKPPPPPDQPRSTEPPGGYVLGFVPSQGLAGAGTAFSYSGLSIGTRRVIQMLTYLVCDQAAVMLLEQPEDSIHSGLLRSIMDVFKSYSDRCQVVFTTHAHQAIDLMDPNAVRLVRSEHGKTMVEKLTQSQIRSAQDFMLEQGTLSEYLDSL